MIMNPEAEIKTVAAQGLADCRKMLALAKTGKYNGYLLEGMGCPGGCVGGAGTMQPVTTATNAINNYKKNSVMQCALDNEIINENEL